MTFFCPLSQSLKDRSPYQPTKFVVLIVSIWKDGCDRVDEQVIVQQAGIWWQQLPQAFQYRKLSRAGEAVQDNDPTSLGM